MGFPGDWVFVLHVTLDSLWRHFDHFKVVFVTIINGDFWDQS